MTIRPGEVGVEEGDNGSDCIIVYHQRNLTQPASPVCARMHLNAQNCCALQFLAKICIDDALCLHISKLSREGDGTKRQERGEGSKAMCAVPLKMTYYKSLVLRREI